MEKSTSKYALIYQFNNESPLFARVAGRYIEEKDFEQAIKILEKGLQNYPEYPTAYYLYSIALANRGEKSKAIEMAKKAAGLHGTTESLKHYTDLIDAAAGSFSEDSSPQDLAEKGEDSFTSPEKVPGAVEETIPGITENEIAEDPQEIPPDREDAVINDEINDYDIGGAVRENDEQKIADDNQMEPAGEMKIEETGNKNVEVNNKDIEIEADGSAGPEEDKIELDNELEMLAEKLSKAFLPSLDDADDLQVDNPSDDTQFSGKSLVSETLAKIHMNQGNYSQALSIYETLIDIQPEKKEYFQVIIAQIKEKL